MASKRQLFEQYGRQEGEASVWVCPDCEPEQKFETLEQWKDHMQKEHGGYTSSEVAEGVEVNGQRPADKGADTGKGSAAPLPKPKKLTARARDLNEKTNRCVSLVVKHLVSGVTSAELEELETLRTAITEAFIGIEFDFEEKLFSLTGKWAVLVVLALLYLLPQVPSMKESIAKAVEKGKSKLLKT